MQVEARWDEADLRNCPGALKQFLALPAQRGKPIWHPAYVKWLKGQKAPRQPDATDDIIITADGDGVFVRVGSRYYPAANGLLLGDNATVVYSQWNGGEGMEWALNMADVVRPCLKPANSPAPWNRVAAGETPEEAGP
jgi:hypothetical protein